MSKVMGHLFLPPPWKSTFPPPVRLPPPLLLLGFFYMRTVQVLLTSRKNVIAHEKKKIQERKKKKIKTTIWDPQFVSCHFSYDFFPPPWDDWKQICLNWQETDVCFRICQRQHMCVWISRTSSGEKIKTRLEPEKGGVYHSWRERG